MRRLILLVVLALLPFGAHAQDRQEELRKKVDQALKEEMDRSRAELLDLLRGELRGTAKAGALEGAQALVTADLLREHVAFLAGDELEGRNAGHPGCDKAADYIADFMKKAELKPAGDEGTYFQKFKMGKRETRNCLGLLEGTDPELKKEYVVVGAHYDHVGTVDQEHAGRLGRPTDDDGIWNGADDNASGTSCILSLVKAFAEGKLRTKRSILFIAFSGEEAGLVGSAHYTRHPIAPIEQHVFMLNLDMVGRNPDKPVEIHGVGSAEGGVLRKVVEEAVAKTGLKAKLNDAVAIAGGDSDHTSFRNKKVPFAFFFTGFHKDYHRVTDHADKLAYDNMAKIAQTSAQILFEIAQRDERPKFSGKGGAPGLKFLPVDPQKAGRRLGINVYELDGDECDALKLDREQGGLRADEVREGTAGEAAGIKVGDVILSVAGVALPREETREALRDVLRDKVKPGREVDIEVLRNGGKVTLKGKWPE